MGIFNMFFRRNNSKFRPTYLEKSDEEINGTLIIKCYNDSHKLCAEVRTKTSYLEITGVNEQINEALKNGFILINSTSEWTELERYENGALTLITLVQDSVLGMNRVTSVKTRGENRKIAIKHASLILNIKN